ncbi:hypothetical protein [Klenkia brasiliensis]|uniref:Uncharacterized protein n=1 Tax=Klenkia brasiliensis TaxID=333142 RepID=A0A1G7Z5V4_9ACTN|nr:hypothetical protein [Klenkia brasiliensis]SDH03886.1 hypothetical protein SAMN05660324_4150 [Klenkia brasiliensis]
MSEPVPEADRLEQQVAVTDEVGPEPTPGTEVDLADFTEQTLAVPHDEDDDRR